MRIARIIFVVMACHGYGSESSTGPSPVPPPAPVSQFRLDGSIADALSKSGISATVDLLTASGTLVAETITDTAGRFTFGFVSPGTYVLTASAPGYESSSQTIGLVSNLIVGMGLNRVGITALMIADPNSGTNNFCKPNGTTASSVSLVNGSSYSVAVTFNGGFQGDPATQNATYRFTLPPSNTRVFAVTPGSYESSGQSLDGRAVLETAGWVFSRGCDFALAICVLNNNRACRLGSTAATQRQQQSIH